MAIDEKCKIIVKDGKHLLTMPNGDIIPYQVYSRVTDAAGQAPFAIVKVWIDLIETKDV